MRINRPDVFDNSNLINVMKLKDLPKEYRFPTILTDKDKIKNIKKIEMVVRSSLEYKDYIKYLREYANMHKCHFFKDVEKESNKKISIEVHHEPFTLYDITQIVLEKWIDEEREINHFGIAEEVMRLHYKNMVGLIPLSVTVHQLVHDGKVFIPVQDVYGKGFVDFVIEYDEYINPDLRRILNEKIDISRDIAVEQDLSILERKYVYIEVDGMKVPALEEFVA